MPGALDGPDGPDSSDGSDGLIIVDKPPGWTSHDVVSLIRRLARTRRVGHAGTLDPMATGVLVLGVNRATRLLTFFVGCDKAYAATVRLGLATVTDDAQGETTGSPGVSEPAATRAALDDAVAALTGEIEQVPSSVSAIKVKGVRSYTRVRAGDEVQLTARPVTVSRFDIVAVRPAHAVLEDGSLLDVLDVDVEVVVSSGTYVRALARDLGAALGVGGHLTALRRTRVGPFGLDLAVPLADLETPGVPSPELPSATTAPGGGRPGEPCGIRLIPMAEAAAAQLPVRAVSAAEATSIGHGQRIACGAHRVAAVAAIDPAGQLVAVIDETQDTARPRVVFAPR
ncbi:MAG: tRNA pseudouridine(55) synthase TruB [Micrococcales bacterium]|nr:tRNA pseudouridine(55) synthase TruB [Micrococcales bacterium]